MNDKAGIGCEKIAKPQAYNDSRFTVIHEKAREIKRLIRELNEMSSHKFGALLGNCPLSDAIKTANEPDCWADSVIYEQDVTLDTLRDTLERISSV